MSRAPTMADFQVGKCMGGGKFGTVNMVVHKPTGGIFALKRVEKEKIKSLNMVNQFILEIKLQSFLHHQYILGLYGYFDDEDCIYLILEYMEQGTLYSELKRSHRSPPSSVSSDGRFQLRRM
jgi:serine/threonine protein kinase